MPSITTASATPQRVKPTTAKPSSALPSIIDIRGEHVEINLKDQIASMFNPDEGPRKLPTLLLYNEKGLQIFEDITYLDEYYLTNYEIEILKKSSAEIASQIPEGSMVIELGSGNLRKVCLLLQAFEELKKPIQYFALDLSLKELERTLAQVPDFKYVSCHGLHGTYDDGREWLKHPSLTSRSKCIIHLGSSIGNFTRDGAADFLGGFAEVLTPSDSMIVAVDSCSNPAQVYHAYNDSKGVTHQFILNGLQNANEILGEEAFNTDEWRVIGEYVYDVEGGRHQAFLSPTRPTDALGSRVLPHERIEIEQSLKYSEAEKDRLWKLAGLTEMGQWSRGDEYGLHFLQKSSMPFSLIPSLYAAEPLPTVQDWKDLWKAWDVVTKDMMPDEELQEKPIKLRNACIFYLGHIPTFLDIQLTKTTGNAPTEPATYYSIFERGIDPDVDNPEHCHTHSEIPDEWPSVQEITTYQDRVRSRLQNLYKNGQDKIPRDIGRAIWVGFEHELMHIETLLYMMLQSDRTLPPPHTVQPDFVKLAQQAYEARVPNQWFDVPEQTITLGMDDPEDGTDNSRHFGWDNEKPARQTKVHAFQAQGRAITNEEYAQYLYNSRIEHIPASWSAIKNTDTNGATNGSHTNGSSNGYSNGNGHHASQVPDSFIQDKFVRTVYGLVPLKYALDWPVFASYDELAGCAAWMGGRIPTFEEAKSIYAHVNKQKRAEAERTLSKTVPAVNGHLVNDGVEETPPSSSSSLVGDGSSELFFDLTEANVGFRHWYPMPVTSRGNKLAGQSEMGGVWEWTSSSLERHEGFEPMSLYPLYTTDFFDGKHNVVLGGSWATHPRIAGRASFVNWYQRNYPYAWVGARLVRDV
ncbi:TAD2-tRNA-specific adenosine deaminase 2 [Fusarium pseudocircinatum]|uniref:TAD2-tRNA-specific adenosine deaminase 2 n=1 Tax=Fusarium pseudocircinatum TaxID=56676 RepID=A0A8H5NYG8_9HYPO|nr:TAD2-tRNA-specific adenosine deaminase 2 [Fusarium pseudocircinatum]